MQLFPEFLQTANSATATGKSQNMGLWGLFGGQQSAEENGFAAMLSEAKDTLGSMGIGKKLSFNTKDLQDITPEQLQEIANQFTGSHPSTMTATLLGDATSSDFTTSRNIVERLQAATRKQLQGTPLPADQVRVEAEDFAALKKALKDIPGMGDVVQNLQNELGDGGMTWGRLITELGPKVDPHADQEMILGDRNKQELNILFQKLGMTGQEAGKLVTDLENGKTAKVWDKVNKAVSGLKDTATLSVTGRELGLLGTALGIEPSALSELNAFVGANPNLLSGKDVSGKTLKMAMSTLNKAGVADVLSEEQDLQDIRKAMAEIMEESINKATNATLADRRETADVARSRRKMSREATDGVAPGREDSMMNKAARGEDSGKWVRRSDNAMQNSPFNPLGQQRMASTRENGTQVPNSPFAAEMTEGDEAAQNNLHVQPKGQPRTDGNAPHFLAARHGNQQGAQNQNSAQQDANFSGQQHNAKQDLESSAWRAMVDSVKVDTSSATGMEYASTTMDQGISAGKKTMADQKVFMARAVQQVEEGLLKNLGQGRKELTLELNPENLGKVMVVLQTSGKEITAVIKTESPEVTHALHDQANQIRASLENQGLKVEKLDIQTQISQEDSSRQWQGMDQHNMAREQSDQARRMATMRLMRQTGGDTMGLAQDMQSTQGTENLSRDGIDLIA